MDRTDRKNEEKNSPAGRELLLSADTSEPVPEQMMHTEEESESSEADEED